MRARRLAWAVFGVSAALSAAGVVLLAQVPAGVLEQADNSLVLSALFAAILLVFGLVGALIASRLPRNPIGWLFLMLALIEGVYELAFGYTHYALQHDLPASWSAWVANWTSPLSPPFLVAALLLFPDGRPPTPRWRWLLWTCVPLFAAIFVVEAFAPGPIDAFPSVRNPAGIDAADWLPTAMGDTVMFALLIAAVAALIVRFRRSHGVERQQVKWFAYAAGLMAGYLIVSTVSITLLGADEDSVAAGFAFVACIAGVPIAVGIAILRHRLYDIDLVIRRTLIYAGLTATLGAAYLATVLLVGLAVGESGFAVAVSTLAVAALFRPALTRIQAVVDRRFYRRRYDATLTLEAFGARLRDELDVEALVGDIRGVVSETVQPTHVSVWLR
jgi:hypothetical protein